MIIITPKSTKRLGLIRVEKNRNKRVGRKCMGIRYYKMCMLGRKVKENRKEGK